MTNEQIENILSELSEFTCDKFDMSLDNLILTVLHYIIRLKDEIAGLTGAVEALKTDNENLGRMLEECSEAFKANKEMLIEVLHKVLALCDGQGGVCYDVDIKAIAEKYGVEVEE